MSSPFTKLDLEYTKLVLEKQRFQPSTFFVASQLMPAELVAKEHEEFTILWNKQSDTRISNWKELLSKKNDDTLFECLFHSSEDVRIAAKEVLNEKEKQARD